MTAHKAFVVADIPEPFRGHIQSIREQLRTITVRFPVEVTLAGSSGLGPIPEGSDEALICAEVERIAGVTAPFMLEFGRISVFPDTGIFYRPPKDRRPFDALHAALASSAIPFTRSAFPYNPHCTLRVGPIVEQNISAQIHSLAIPAGEVMIDSVSVYAIEAGTLTVSLLHRTKLTN